MKYKEFLEYLEANLDGYAIFMEKALEYQNAKNKNRETKKRWDADKMKRAANEMWKKSMEPLYNNLKREIKADVAKLWVNYIAEHEIFETTNDGIRELDFNE